jgi:hypothetical protein
LLRTLGLLGALEPAKHATIVKYLKGSISSERKSTVQEDNTKLRAFSKDSISSSSNGETNNNVNDKSVFAKIKSKINERSIDSPFLIQTESLLEGDKSDTPAYLYMYEQSFMKSICEPSPTDVTVRHTPNGDEYYPKLAVSAIINILKDSSISIHHSSATQTIIEIFKGLGSRCSIFLDQIVTHFLQVLH